VSREKQIQSIHDVSQSFCLAKWLQVTIDLMHGTTHSCHHPERHSIPLDELKKDPSALHNTSFKMQQRKKMLEGERPSECEYCWKIEDSKGPESSDRFIKSLDDWAYPRLEEVTQHPWNQPIRPSYVELMLDNVCNFNCSYCFADISTSIAKEMKAHGPLKVKNNSHRLERDSSRKTVGENPFLKAFWEWLPELLPTLKVLRLTGGEPLLSQHTAKIFDYIDQLSNKELTLAVNTNLNVPKNLIERFCQRVESLKAKDSLRSFELYTSVDTYGQQAEFIRNGLNYDQYIKNLEMMAERFPDEQIVLMCTYNILCIPQFDLFLEQVFELKRRFPKLVLDISYLKEPEYLRASLADENLIEKCFKDLDLMRSLSRKERGAGYTEYEISKYERICHWVLKGEQEKDLYYHRGDFSAFVRDYSKRIGRSFDEIFPQLKSFYQKCYKAEVLHSKVFEQRDS
jgi:organic radical activating enzyme